MISASRNGETSVKVNKFSKTSWARLEGVHPYLVDLFTAVLQLMDCTVIYGMRTFTEHQILFEKGLTKTMNSMHLKQEDGRAWAVDVAPYPIDWQNTKRFYFFAGLVIALADKYLPEGYYIRWGGDWDSDKDLDDQTFMDLVHFELRKR